jgi:nucleotide-binding universal stress UspA family protein
MSIAGSALDLRLKSVLMATDLSSASVKPLHHALALARYYGAKLCVAHVVSPVPYLMAGPEALEFVVQFGIPSEKILQVALDKRVDLIIMGLRRASLSATISHMPWATAYEIVCRAGCPVLTVRQ